jgi:hypothetical protein
VSRLAAGHFVRRTRRRVALWCGACLVSAGVIGASAPLAAGSVGAVTCAGPVVAGTDCTITGTLVMTSGVLSLTSPTALGWAETMNGNDQALVDPAVADQSVLVDDATGSAPGWHITVSATTFTFGTATLADTGTFAVNGSLASITATLAPNAACAVGSTCTLPNDVTSYPGAITTGTAAPVENLYDATTPTGQESINIGASSGGHPIGWWLNVPSNVTVGTYTSTITLEIIAGP